jgi:hypothetical protein
MGVKQLKSNNATFFEHCVFIILVNMRFLIAQCKVHVPLQQLLYSTEKLINKKFYWLKILVKIK